MCRQENECLMVLLACWLAGAQHILPVLQSGVQIFVNGSGPSGRRSGFVFCATALWNDSSPIVNESWPRRVAKRYAFDGLDTPFCSNIGYRKDHLV